VFSVIVGGNWYTADRILGSILPKVLLQTEAIKVLIPGSWVALDYERGESSRREPTASYPATTIFDTRYGGVLWVG
jgi:hypothetical protein